MTADEIAVDAFRLALDDSGLQKSDIDGLITCKSFGGHGIDTEIGRLAGLNPRYSATLEYGTCNFSLHLAAMALASGMATTIALLYGTNQRSAGNRFAHGCGQRSRIARTAWIPQHRGTGRPGLQAARPPLRNDRGAAGLGSGHRAGSRTAQSRCHLPHPAHDRGLPRASPTWSNRCGGPTSA